MKSTWKMMMITVALGILFLGILGGFGSVNATETNTTADANEESQSSFWEKLQDFFIGILDTLVAILLAPFNAIKTIFERWGETLGSWWYAPILAVFVIGVAWFMIRGMSAIDRALDSTE